MRGVNKLGEGGLSAHLSTLVMRSRSDGSGSPCVSAAMIESFFSFSPSGKNVRDIAKVSGRLYDATMHDGRHMW